MFHPYSLDRFSVVAGSETHIDPTLGADFIAQCSKHQVLAITIPSKITSDKCSLGDECILAKSTLLVFSLDPLIIEGAAKVAPVSINFVGSVVRQKVHPF